VSDIPPVGSRRDRILRRLYAPYAWLVFGPILAIVTTLCGTLAMAVGMFSHRAAFWFGVPWGWIICRANWTSVRVLGRENAVPGQAYVILCNHMSLIDVPSIYGHWPRQFRWVMKQELRRVPFIGWASAVLGCLFIDRRDRASAIASLQRARPLLDQGISVFFFPEGTRSRTGRLQPFKKGGFVLAQDTGLPILPISVSGSFPILPGGSRGLLPGRITISIHPPIPTSGTGPEDRPRLIQMVRDAIVSGLEPRERPLPGSGGEGDGDVSVPARQPVEGPPDR
jgi:1-acyl-sn-glycerol-3-phosphate acyltransferase